MKTLSMQTLLTSAAALALCSTSALAEGPDITFEAPSIYVAGQPFEVKVELQIGETETPIASWLLQPSAFSIDGQPVKPRAEGALIPLPPNTKLTVEFDLAEFIGERGDFELTYAAKIHDKGPIQVMTFQPAAAEDGGALDFMNMDEALLDGYRVVVQTNRGPLLMEFWPEVAPGHVRNFLDLASSGFYDETLFHRVGRGFMIQGGDPYTKDPANVARWGQGNGPRRLQAEFNDRRHVEGVLSMARSQDRNSASSQFFVMHGTNPGLDNNYTAFGTLVASHGPSFETLDRIANSPGSRIDSGTVRPNDPQRILSATVVKKDSKNR
jgi:peptidyl-prolyl cis-trans isomerase B (cyclophilin B)